jgi:hypothetical protein
VFGIVSQAQRVQARLKTLARLNLELATLEGKKRSAALGFAGGLGVAAVVFVLYGLGFLLYGAAAGLSTYLPVWASFLIVGGVLIAVAAIAVAVAVPQAKKVSARWQALDETERTVDTVRTHA